MATQPRIVMIAATLLLCGCSLQPDWKKGNPPLWAYVASTDKNRFFINTKAFRKDIDTSTVKVLLRSQTIASGEKKDADKPKDDEYTTVQNFTCDPSKQGYELSARLWLFSAKQLPESIPPDSELPKGIAWKDFTEIKPGTVIEEARRAACFLAHY